MNKWFNREGERERGWRDVWMSHREREPCCDQGIKVSARLCVMSHGHNCIEEKKTKTFILMKSGLFRKREKGKIE